MAYIGKQPRKAALTASDIEDGIITAAKIEDGAVVAAEIASNAVTTAKINADAVTGAKIADDSVDSEHLVAAGIDKEHLTDHLDIFAGTSLSAADLGAGVHIKIADSGASVAANYDEIVIENSDHAGMSILTGTDKVGAVRFGDSGDNDIGGVLYNHDDNSMTFKVNAADKWKIDSTGNLIPGATTTGIYLGVTSATAANLLDDYEEGTFTPIIKFGGGTTGISATQVGAYTKIGNLVTLQIFIEFSNKGSSTGAATISGIPFTIATLTSSWSGVGTAPLVWHNMASSLVQAGATVNRSSQLLNLFGHTASNGNGTNQALTNTDFANNSYFGITAAYLST